mmetsp:Transcript_24434/g.49508  ORF Transcript_24434/g.49508 Transcript_24434/m.49508 type:complete len:102 (-) Transcript_24434:1369-1674(-)
MALTGWIYLCSFSFDSYGNTVNIICNSTAFTLHIKMLFTNQATSHIAKFYRPCLLPCCTHFIAELRVIGLEFIGSLCEAHYDSVDRTSHHAHEDTGKNKAY